MSVQEINLETIIPPEHAGRRLDQSLAALFPQHSRARLQTWIRKGQIQVNNKSLRPKDKVEGGESVCIQATQENAISDLAQEIALTIIHEDADILVINKPVGLVVHPGAGGRRKVWPGERTAELVELLIEKSWRPMLLLGPAEDEYIDWTASHLPSVPILREENLVTLAAVLSLVDLYIGFDSGVSHLAAAVGTRSLVIFGPTDPAVWRPLGDNVIVVNPPDGKPGSIERVRLDQVTARL